MAVAYPRDGSGEEEALQGAKVYHRACAVCHDTGAAGAPRLTAPDDWQARLVKGRDKLVQNSIEGIGAMPPKGGRADLSDEEVRAAVRYMIEQVP